MTLADETASNVKIRMQNNEGDMPKDVCSNQKCFQLIREASDSLCQGSAKKVSSSSRRTTRKATSKKSRVIIVVLNHCIKHNLPIHINLQITFHYLRKKN